VARKNEFDGQVNFKSYRGALDGKKFDAELTPEQVQSLLKVALKAYSREKYGPYNLNANRSPKRKKKKPEQEPNNE
jgi:hypothetical protein